MTREKLQGLKSLVKTIWGRGGENQFIYLPGGISLKITDLPQF